MSRAHSPTLPSLYLRHSPFSNPSVALPTSQPILQSFRRFTYVTAHSSTLPLLNLRHSSFSNPSFASPTSQVLHLRHLASRPWYSRNLVGLRYTRYVHKVSFPIVPQLVNHLLREATACTVNETNSWKTWTAAPRSLARVVSVWPGDWRSEGSY